MKGWPDALEGWVEHHRDVSEDVQAETLDESEGALEEELGARARNACGLWEDCCRLV